MNALVLIFSVFGAMALLVLYIIFLGRTLQKKNCPVVLSLIQAGNLSDELAKIAVKLVVSKYCRPVCYCWCIECKSSFQRNLEKVMLETLLQEKNFGYSQAESLASELAEPVMIFFSKNLTDDPEREHCEGQFMILLQDTSKTIFGALKQDNYISK